MTPLGRRHRGPPWWQEGGRLAGEGRRVPDVRRGEAGTGIVSTAFGFAAFMGFVLLGVHVAVALHARSTASAIGFDVARRAAAAGEACGPAAAAAPDALRDRLGGWWRDVEVAGACDGEAVRLTLTASRSRAAARAVRQPLGLDRFERTWVVRVERPR